MKIRNTMLGALALGLAAGGAIEARAQSGESVYVPLLTYRTGAFAGSGIPIANGMHDYLTMLNERDGGIGGARIVVEECETGYDAQKGVECYESTKGNNPVMYNPYSTGITLQLIPKASVDKIPVLSMGYGLSAAAVGDKFPYVFNLPATYWDQASAIIKYIGEQEGGMDALEGKKIGFIYLDAGYGREPIPLLEQLAENYGFELLKYPVGVKEMQNQSAQWLRVRRDRPDYMVMWGWGAMSPTAIKEAAKIRYPMDKFIGVWWSGGDNDVKPAGAGAKGFKAVNFHGTGDAFGALQDIKTYVVDAGKSEVSSADEIGENMYNRGVMNAVVIAEAIRKAQEITGKTVVGGEDVRKGLEALDLTEERLVELGLEGFTTPMKVSCEDHAGGNPMYIMQWNGSEWERASENIEPMNDVVRPLLEKAADEYVKTNSPWPERTEECVS